MTVIPIRLLAPLALSLAAPFAVSSDAQVTQERSGQNPVQDARGAQGGARGGQTPPQQTPEQQQAAKRKEQQAREAAQKEKERQAGRQPDARQPEGRAPAPTADQKQLEQRKANARQQQQAEQEKLEQRKANARQQQQDAQKGAADKQGRGALPAAQRDAVTRWAAEMRTHRDRVARIERLKELATTGKQRDRLAELDQLLARENKRHEGKLARLEGAIDPAVLRQLQGRLGKAGGDGAKRGAPPVDGAPVEKARGDAAGAKDATRSR